MFVPVCAPFELIDGQITISDLEIIKNLVLTEDRNSDASRVRILDQAEVQGANWGSNCTMQVYSNMHGGWISCCINGKYVMSFSKIYKLLRSEFKYEGPLRLAVAVP